MDYYEILLHECGKRHWDIDVLLDMAQSLPNVGFYEKLNSKSPPTARPRSAASIRRLELNRKAKQVITEIKEKRKKTLKPDGNLEEETTQLCKDVANAAISVCNGNAAETARRAGVSQLTLRRLANGYNTIGFDNLMRIARVAKITISIQQEV